MNIWVQNIWHDAKSHKSNQEKINVWRLKVVSQRINIDIQGGFFKGFRYQKQMSRVYDNTTNSL